MAFDLTQPHQAPGQLGVGPLGVGRLPLGDDAPVGPGRGEAVRVLEEEATADLAQLQGLGGRRRRGQDAGVLAASDERLDGPVLVAGRDDDVGLGRGDHALDGGRVDGPVDGHDPPERGAAVALVRPLVGVGQASADRHAARVGVLDDHRGRLVAEVVDAAPRRVGVVDVEVAERQPRVLLDGVPPARGADPAVPGAPLVRVLAVAGDLGTFEGQVERRGELVGGARAFAVEPLDDGRVVGRGRGERLARPAPGGAAGATRRRSGRPRGPSGSRPGRRARPRGRGSWPRRGSSPGRRCR